MQKGLVLKMNTSKLQLFNLIDDTVALLSKNQPIYIKAVSEITQLLSSILYEANDQLMDLNTRIKSPVSVKEKIIRNKLYKKHALPEEILGNLPDIIGIMISCRFNKNEVEILETIKKHFCLTDNNIMYYSEKSHNMCFNLSMPQPQNQKNGHEIYRIDGQYVIDGITVNFELQIKSLVNTFWSEVEHKVVYKNNIYIPNYGYIMEMLTAIKGNLVGIDKMLQLVHDQIQDFSTQKTEANIDINFAIAKLISDTFVAKMSESIGFTVDFKRICDLISGYILNKYTDLPVRMAQSAFLDLVHRFNEIYVRDINWEQELHLEDKYIGEDKFCQIFGNRLISFMNTDFEWHVFFLILFQIESDNNNLQSFTEFMRTIKSNYSDKRLYKKLYTAFDKDTADKMYETITEFLAYTLSATASINIIDSNSEDIRNLIDQTISYIIEHFSSYDSFITHRKPVQMMILEKWGA